MNTATAFDQSALDDEDSIALKQLNSFLEKPHAIGLDNLKESLRNMVQLMLELKGYKTGYQVHHLVRGEHSSLAMAGVLPGDEDKRKRMEQFYRDLMELEKQMAKMFARIFKHVAKKIVAVEQHLDAEIEAIDEKIEALADTPEQAAMIKAKSSKRRKLLTFKKHVKQKAEELEDATTTEEVLDIQSDLAEDAQDFRNDAFDPMRPKRGTWDIFGKLIRESKNNQTQKIDHGHDLFTPYEFDSYGAQKATIGIDSWKSDSHFNDERGFDDFGDDKPKKTDDTSKSGEGETEGKGGDSTEIEPPQVPEV